MLSYVYCLAQPGFDHAFWQLGEKPIAYTVRGSALANVRIATTAQVDLRHSAWVYSCLCPSTVVMLLPTFLLSALHSVLLTIQGN